MSGGSVTGETIPNTVVVKYPPIDATKAQFNNNNDTIPPNMLDKFGNVKVSSQPLYLDPGTYYFSGNVSVTASGSGNGAIYISGPTTIYVAGNLDVGGSGIVNTTTIPNNCKIYLLGSSAKFAGQATLYANIYGPGTDIRVVGGGAFYGTAIGKTLSASGGGAYHYDEALNIEVDYVPRSISIVQ